MFAVRAIEKYIKIKRDIHFTAENGYKRLFFKSRASYILNKRKKNLI